MQGEQDLSPRAASGWNAGRAEYVCCDSVVITGMDRQSNRHPGREWSSGTSVSSPLNGVATLRGYLASRSPLVSMSGTLFTRDVITLLSGRCDVPAFTPPPTVKIIGEQAF